MKKIRSPKQNKRGNYSMPGQDAVFAVPGAFENPSASIAIGAEPDDSGFGVNVRNEAAGIEPIDKKAKASWWLREFPHEIACALAIMTPIAFILAAAYMPGAIPFVLAGAALYLALVVLGEKADVRFKYLAAGGVAVLLLLTGFFLRKYTMGGIGYIMNMVYDASEAEQAYIYQRLGTGAADENSDICVRAGIVWASVLFAALAALPEASARRKIGLMFAAAGMIAFAYYGLVPQAVITGLVIVALLFVMARGSMLSSLPVLLASLLLFAAIMMIAPGENYAISRADENFRDRFALRSAFLEKEESVETPQDVQDVTRGDPLPDDVRELDLHRKWVLPLVIAGTVILISAILFLIYRRYRKRRDENRRGIDAEDIRTAIVSMFPYAVKWLGAADIEVKDKAFASLVDPLRDDMSEQYSNYFRSMYVLWREAAYSDHEMDDEKRAAMKEFVDDTKEMVQRDMGLKDKLRLAMKYAL